MLCLHHRTAQNCHRGAALGALMGAAHGERAIPQRLIQGLHDSAAIRAEIDAYSTQLAMQMQQASTATGNSAEL